MTDKSNNDYLLLQVRVPGAVAVLPRQVSWVSGISEWERERERPKLR